MSNILAPQNFGLATPLNRNRFHVKLRILNPEICRQCLHLAREMMMNYNKGIGGKQT